MSQTAAMREPAIRLSYEGKVVSRVWKCNSCGLKLYLAQKSEYPKLKCLCGRSYWLSCQDAERT